MDAIARQVGLSRSVLQRRFRALLKRSVHQQILITKIKHAEQRGSHMFDDGCGPSDIIWMHVG